MTDAYEIWQKPQAKEIYMLVGWRQWADAGSVSSGIPQYLIQLLDADPIGYIRPDGFYIFQIPGTHDLMRPVVEFKDGLPKSLQTQRNEFYYSGNQDRGLVIFLGDEPHLDIERYADAIIQAAEEMGVTRIVGLGGVYGELPYDKERLVSCIYSLPEMKEEVSRLSVSLSDYQGGASIGSYVCSRAGKHKMPYLGFYAFVPAYDFSSDEENGRAIRLENDFAAWLAILQRLNYMLKLGIDLTNLKEETRRLVDYVDQKVDEIDQEIPQTGVREYLNALSENFSEVTFNPLDDVWEEEIRRLLDKFEDDEG